MKKRFWSLLLVTCLLLQLLPTYTAAAETVTGTIEKRNGYDVATVRYELTDGSYFFADFEETAVGYTYHFTKPNGAYTVKAEFFSEKVWDGAVDISWYNAEQKSFYLDTPAKLAGLAALVNGQVDADTPDYRIKGNQAELVSTRTDNFLLVGAGGGNQYGTVYVGDEAHDFSDKIVYLTADMDMGGVCNWTPIGGKYPMDVKNSDVLIEAFFNGTLDGQGHRIVNLMCDRYAAKGYAYSQAVGFIGYLGELYDGECVPQRAPTVRNLSISGSVYGRRMVGGVCGRTGGIPTGVYFENCANFASVKNTDSKGIGGIVGAGWSKGAIVNCYNTGSVTTIYACPAGGICGSNGGLDIFNCYNVGKIDSNGNCRGRAIGGHNSGAYTVSDCYYLIDSDDDPDSNGWYCGTALSNKISIQGMNAEAMRSNQLRAALNVNGDAYVQREGAYPVLAWEASGQGSDCNVTIIQPEGGSIAADCTTEAPFGTVLHLSNTPAPGWAFRAYTLNGAALTGRYATLTANATISGIFSRLVAGALYIQSNSAFTIQVTKNGMVMQNGVAERVTNYPVADGDPLYEGDELIARAMLLPNAEPEDLSYVYNGKFRYYFTFMDEAETQKSTDTGRFIVTDKIASASLRLHAVAYTAHKVWTELAQTDWYREEANSFTLTTARQIAGLAALVKQGKSFAGKTVRLGADISLSNDDKTYNRSVRWFDGIGTTQSPFAGTFDGCGYRITEMTAASVGSGAALFLATDGAILQNIRVSGKVSANGSAAGIVAQAKNTKLIHCVNDAEIIASGEKAGGIVAFADHATVFEDCVNNGYVSGSDGVGGVVGVLSDKDSTLTDCLNYGCVTGKGAAVGIGGIAGRIGGKLTRCANYGNITGSCWYAGGVVGSCVTDGASELVDCFNVAAVSNAHSYASSGTGGIIGYGNYYRAENCFNYGSVSAVAGVVGGVVGKDSDRSDNVRRNLYYHAAACAFACNGKTASSGVQAVSAADFASEAFLKRLNVNHCFAIANGRYPEFSTACSHAKTVLKHVKESTCTEEGYSGDRYCSICGVELEKGSALPKLACPGVKFTDMPAKDNWAHAGIDFCLTGKLFDGVGGGRFDPDGKMTRAMLVTVLWRLEKQPETTNASPFRDVANSAWYAKAVSWAAANEVVNGVGNGEFDPNGNITREQIATIMYRYAVYKGKGVEARAKLEAFPDARSVSVWAYEALSWANAADLITGTRENGMDYLAPQQYASRAQVSAILMRYVKSGS